MKNTTWLIIGGLLAIIGVGYLLKKASAANSKATLGPWVIADPDTGLWSNVIDGATAQVNKISYMRAYWRNDSEVAITGSVTIRTTKGDMVSDIPATAGNNVTAQPGEGAWVSFELNPQAGELGIWSMTASVVVDGQVKDSRTVSIMVI